MPKTKKRYLMPPCLTLNIITYGLRVSGAIQENELRPPVAAFEKKLLVCLRLQLANLFIFHIYRKNALIVMSQFSLNHKIRRAR